MNSTVKESLSSLKLQYGVSAATKKKLVIVPTGGLGNRMRTLAILPALQNCENKLKIDGVEFKVFWPKLSHLNADFGDLFSFPRYERIKLQTELTEDFIFITQRSKGMGIDLFSNWLNITLTGRFHAVQNLQSLGTKTLEKYFADGKSILMASAWGLPTLSTSKNCRNSQVAEFYNTLRPSTVVESFMTEVTNTFKEVRAAGKKVIGIHLRQSDLIRHPGYRKETASRTEALAFIQGRISKESAVVFIATDERDEELLFREGLESFGLRVLALQNPDKFNEFGESNRNSTEGQQLALADLFLLSKCNELWSNSRHSTYAKLAARVGGLNIKYMK